MSKKSKYKVMAGTHIEGNKKYKEGEVVESDRRLDKVFPSKFKRLGSRRTTPAPDPDLDDDTDDTHDDDEVTDDDLDTGDAADEVKSDDIVVRHRGSGKWGVFNIGTENWLTDSNDDPISVDKEDAEELAEEFVRTNG